MVIPTLAVSCKGQESLGRPKQIFVNLYHSVFTFSFSGLCFPICNDDYSYSRQLISDFPNNVATSNAGLPTSILSPGSLPSIANEKTS